MDIYGDLDFNETGHLIAAALKSEPTAQFPDVAAGNSIGAIKQGRLAFFNNRVWIAGTITTVGSPQTEVATWIPLTNEINAYVHTQGAGSTSWVITHSLNAGTPAVQVYDETNSMVIPDEVVPTDANTVTITFNASVTGRAIILAGIFDGATP